jgi:hypothetical protein
MFWPNVAPCVTATPSATMRSSLASMKPGEFEMPVAFFGATT